MDDDNAFNIFESPSSSTTRPANNQNVPPATTSVWIFGYGSLCWFPGTEYSKCVTGYIRGYVRRFWQGNVTHRGTKSKPGRVATLIDDEKGVTWGCAYKIVGDAALEYLKERECTLGGYATRYTKFYPRVARENSEITGEAFPALLYIATPTNMHWKGEESLSHIAKEIVESSGPSGHNVEYLVKLAIFMREEIPNVHDEHLFELERLVREILDEKEIALEAVMGPPIQRIRRDSHENILRPSTFEFTSRVPETKLRCLCI